jgi:RNA polymerase sigma-70 factor (ECF subfamily)
MEQKTVTADAPPEASLIALAQNGDRHAFGELVRRYQNGVVQVIYRMCGNADLAQDAAQDAFIRAWLNLPDLRPGSSFRNWLYRIAVNVAIDTLRRDTKTTDMEIETLAIADHQDGPEAALVRKEQALAVQQAIQGLTEASRKVLVLREYGELSYSEIADVLGIPLGTVMSRLNYARQQLKKALQRHLIKMELEYE